MDPLINVRDAWFELTENQHERESIEALIMYGQELSEEDKCLLVDSSIIIQTDKPKDYFAKYAIARMLLGLPPQNGDENFSECLSQVPEIAERVMIVSVGSIYYPNYETSEYVY